MCEHPRLFTLLVGLGISFSFTSFGRFSIHEILEPGYAIPPATCAACAKEFAPGFEKDPPSEVEDLVPGREAESPGDAKDLAPGDLKKKEID